MKSRNRRKTPRMRGLLVDGARPRRDPVLIKKRTKNEKWTNISSKLIDFELFFIKCHQNLHFFKNIFFLFKWWEIMFLQKWKFWWIMIQKSSKSIKFLLFSQKVIQKWSWWAKLHQNQSFLMIFLRYASIFFTSVIIQFLVEFQFLSKNWKITKVKKMDA